MSQPASEAEGLGYPDPDEFENFDEVDSTTITEGSDDFNEGAVDHTAEDNQ